jgi:hypothetical protein
MVHDSRVFTSQRRTSRHVAVSVLVVQSPAPGIEVPRLFSLSGNIAAVLSMLGGHRAVAIIEVLLGRADDACRASSRAKTNL